VLAGNTVRIDPVVIEILRRAGAVATDDGRSSCKASAAGDGVYATGAGVVASTAIQNRSIFIMKIDGADTETHVIQRSITSCKTSRAGGSSCASLTCVQTVQAT
jgi:hypothetical protein